MGRAPDVNHYTTNEPLGVVGLITPWNDPIAVASTDSTDVGTTVYDTVTADGERVQSEMGGRTPALVSSTANPDEAASTVARE
jgi:acyl-CoA reductase-like NAD-dependent aldehyde dehydrogenase